MSKVFTYVFVTVGMIMLFNLAGLNTGTGVVLGWLGNNFSKLQNFATSGLWNTLIVVAVGALAVIGGISVALRGYAPTTAITALYVAPLIALTGDMIYFYVTATSWVQYLIGLIIAPFVVSYAVALYEWVTTRG